MASVYPSIRDLPQTFQTDLAEVPRSEHWFRIPRTVIFLGLTSMLTDISTEMVGAILPLYLMLELHFTPFLFGVFDGLYQGITALVRIAGGLIADRRRRYKEVASVGYALSACCKLGLVFAGTVWLPTLLALLLDRVGKGIRTAPRDALISLHSPHAGRAEAFGVHRALDTTGALMGPVVAFSLLAWLPGAYHILFASSFCIGLLGLMILLLFVNANMSALNRPSIHTPASLSSALRLLHNPFFRRIVLTGTLLSLMSASDAFIYLTMHRRSTTSLSAFPLLYVGTALIYLLLAIPLGRLADRIGRGRVFLGGHVLLLGVYGLLLQPSLAPLTLGGCLLLLGAYYAATDGVLMALASTALPCALLTTGLALLTTATALARFAASVGFGAFWAWGGPEFALATFGIGLVVACVISVILFEAQEDPFRR
jgi:MFS family permease